MFQNLETKVPWFFFLLQGSVCYTDTTQWCYVSTVPEKKKQWSTLENCWPQAWYMVLCHFCNAQICYCQDREFTMKNSDNMNWKVRKPESLNLKTVVCTWSPAVSVRTAIRKANGEEKYQSGVRSRTANCWSNEQDIFQKWQVVRFVLEISGRSVLTVTISSSSKQLGLSSLDTPAELLTWAIRVLKHRVVRITLYCNALLANLQLLIIWNQ